ncbi:MAG: hypothetical protein NTY00_13135 [Deltaproteobacteria bacterium]|nr:hypothetical protein [Deltaproteobacteria bacterium]
MKIKVRGGRPPKFNEKSSPITVTLPHRTVQQLESVNVDRAKAIVKCVDSTIGSTWTDEKKVEVVQISEDTGLIVVGPSWSLKRIPWLRLVEIAPCRFLMTVPTGTAIESLEVAIMDLIEDLPQDELSEKTLLTDLRQKLSHHRRQEEVSKGEILFISTKLGLCFSIMSDFFNCLEFGSSAL